MLHSLPHSPVHYHRHCLAVHLGTQHPHDGLLQLESHLVGQCQVLDTQLAHPADALRPVSDSHRLNTCEPVDQLEAHVLIWRHDKGSFIRQSDTSYECNTYIHRDDRSDDEGIVVLFMLMPCYEDVVCVPTYDPQHIADDRVTQPTSIVSIDTIIII